MSRKIVEIRNGSLHGPVRSYVGTSNIAELNPFVLWDHFYIPKAEGLAGFGFHGHSGVATISYPQVGDIEHVDTGGHTGVLGAGGVQIMSAGSGVLHKETVYPSQMVADAFQLWVALPSEKMEMGKVEYSTAQINELPVVDKSGVKTKVVVGRFEGVQSSVTAPVAMTYLHVHLDSNKTWEYCAPKEQTTALIYVKTGKVLTGGVEISNGELGVFEAQADVIDITSPDSAAEFVVITGKPLNQEIISNGSSVHSATENLVIGVQNINKLQNQMANATI